MRRGATGELEDAMHRGMDKVRKERGVLPDVHLGEPVVHRIVGAGCYWAPPPFALTVCSRR